MSNLYVDTVQPFSSGSLTLISASLQGLTNISSSQVLYYNTASGEVYYDDAPAGGSSISASFATSASFAQTASCANNVKTLNYDIPDPGNYFYTNVLSTGSGCKTVNTLGQYGLYYNASTNRNVSPVDLQGNLIGTASFATSASRAISASSAPNIYNSDGALTGTRTVDLNGENLTFLANGGESFIITSDPGSDVSITGLPQTTTNNVIYYNTSSGQLTYGVSPTSSIAVSTSASYLSAYNTASFYPTSSVTASFQLPEIDFQNNISVVSGSRITMANTGIYDIQFSAQVTKNPSSNVNVYVWLSKNGVDIPWTNTEYALAGGSNEEYVLAWNWYASASAGDYYEIKYSADGNNAIFLAKTGVTGPDIPSLIVTVGSVGGGNTTISGSGGTGGGGYGWSDGIGLTGFTGSKNLFGLTGSYNYTIQNTYAYPTNISASIFSTNNATIGRAVRSAIIAGNDHRMQDNTGGFIDVDVIDSIIMGGTSNKIYGDAQGVYIIGGNNNSAEAAGNRRSGIIGGGSNNAYAIEDSVIIGGSNNLLRSDSDRSVVIGGANNTYDFQSDNVFIKADGCYQGTGRDNVVIIGARNFNDNMQDYNVYVGVNGGGGRTFTAGTSTVYQTYIDKLNVSGSLEASGSITIAAGKVLTMQPIDPLPASAPSASFAVSGSTPKPYFWDGANWNALY